MADPNANARLVALRATRLIGVKADAAIPALVKLVGDPDGRIRVEAIIAVGAMGPAKKRAMTELIAALNDSETYVRANAAQVLGEIGDEAKSALPGLTRLLNATNSYTRVQSAIAIWRIVGDTNMVSVLKAELNGTPEVPTCSWILSALGEMGPVAKPAIPAILRTIQGQRGVSNVHGIDISSVGLKALEKIDPDAAAEAK